jgi:hypothetical protein
VPSDPDVDLFVLVRVEEPTDFGDDGFREACAPALLLYRFQNPHSGHLGGVIGGCWNERLKQSATYPTRLVRYQPMRRTTAGNRGKRLRRGESGVGSDAREEQRLAPKAAPRFGTAEGGWRNQSNGTFGDS